jgi:hypothetical protein
MSVLYDWEVDFDMNTVVAVPRVVAEFVLARLLRDTAPLHPTAHDEAVAALRVALDKPEADWAPPKGIPRPRTN